MGLDDIDESDDDILPPRLSKSIEVTKKSESAPRPDNAKNADADATSSPAKATTTEKKDAEKREVLDVPDNGTSSRIPEQKFVIGAPGLTKNDTGSTADDPSQWGENAPSVPAHYAEEDTGNDAADELLKMMQKKRQQKQALKKEEEKKAEAQKNKELLKEGGLFKKGFLKSAKPAKTGGASSSSSPKNTKKADQEVIDLSKNEKMQKGGPDFSIPEVQDAMKAKLSDTNSWLTPELQKVMRSRPDLLAGFSDPRVQECLAMMRTNPVAAKEKFKNDKDVTKYLDEFSRLMGTHFELLGKKEQKEAGKENKGSGNVVASTSGGGGVSLAGQVQQGQPPTSTSSAPPKKTMSTRKAIKEAAKQNGLLSNDEQKRLAKPEVLGAMADPKVQQIIAMARQGNGLDMRAIGRDDPGTFQKLRVLVENGILGLGR
ncbi:unnamed protein product [Amoebophrya sp. A25]|nr:unnamed protein product [Amoebophrya sp. A25]|eukprot:GSA25T00017703001.1